MTDKKSQTRQPEVGNGQEIPTSSNHKEIKGRSEAAQALASTQGDEQFQRELDELLDQVDQMDTLPALGDRDFRDMLEP